MRKLIFLDAERVPREYKGEWGTSVNIVFSEIEERNPNAVNGVLISQHVISSFVVEGENIIFVRGEGKLPMDMQEKIVSTLISIHMDDLPKKTVFDGSLAPTLYILENGNAKYIVPLD